MFLYHPDVAEAIYLHPAEARRRFREFAAGEITYDNLAEGALLIALEDNPQIAPEVYTQELESLAARVKKRFSPGDPPVFHLGHLHAELFDREGFSGNVDDYYDPKNSYLHEVLATKRGIPITLSTIFIHVARRVGLDAVGVGLPGHYIVKVRFEMSEVYVDPFHGGSTLSIAEIDQFLADRSNGQLRLRSEYLRAWSARETLVRILSNLQNAWGKLRDTRRALAARERIELLAGSTS
jgi:regulator of sirC expression with transglutaminase-like and TPR domain